MKGTLKIEDYIAKRKREDGLNEFDTTSRSTNTKVIVD